MGLTIMTVSYTHLDVYKRQHTQNAIQLVTHVEYEENPIVNCSRSWAVSSVLNAVKRVDGMSTILDDNEVDTLNVVQNLLNTDNVCTFG